MDQWITLSGIDSTFDRLIEVILRDQLLHSCPRNQALIIREHTPKKGSSSFMEIAVVLTASRSAVGIRDPFKMTPIHRRAVQNKDRNKKHPNLSHVRCVNQ